MAKENVFPVYLIAGFLDSGKTSFINGILSDGFALEDRTMLLCCEEGEVEYDPKVLRNVTVVTAEDHSIVGGLGSAIAEALCEDPKPMAFVGIKDTFGCSGHTYQEVLAYHGLTAEKIVDAVRKLQRSY